MVADQNTSATSDILIGSICPSISRNLYFTLRVRGRTTLSTLDVVGAFQVHTARAAGPPVVTDLLACRINIFNFCWFSSGMKRACSTYSYPLCAGTYMVIHHEQVTPPPAVPMQLEACVSWLSPCHGGEVPVRRRAYLCPAGVDGIRHMK